MINIWRKFLEAKKLLVDAFPIIVVRNQELDNTLISEGTIWEITDINGGGKVITLDNPLPVLEGLNEDGRDSVYDYWGLYKSYYQLVQIESADYEANTITYSSIVGGFLVGDKVTFFNPFRKGRMVNTDPLLTPSQLAWCSSDPNPGGILKHSDGSYKMLVNGITGSYRIGLATSDDLATWTPEGSSAIFLPGVAPFDDTWMSSGGLFCTSNPLEIVGSPGQYYLPLTIKNSGGLWEAFFCIIDEDMNVLSVMDDPISITGYSNTHGNTNGGIAYHDGSYKMTICHRTTALQDWTVFELVLGDVMNGEVLEVNQITVADGSSTWIGNHVDQANLIVYNDELYTIIGGTGTGGESTNEVYSGNRCYGIFSKIDGNWVNSKKNPVISAPIEGETIWGNDLLWATDHAGGYGGWIIENNIFYFFISMNNGTGTYRPAGLKFEL